MHEIRTYPCSDQINTTNRQARVYFCALPTGHKGPHEHVPPAELQRRWANPA